MGKGKGKGENSKTNEIGRESISRDNKWISYTETATEGDIWIATLDKGSK